MTIKNSAFRKHGNFYLTGPELILQSYFFHFQTHQGFPGILLGGLQNLRFQPVFFEVLRYVSVTFRFSTFKMADITAPPLDPVHHEWHLPLS